MSFINEWQLVAHYPEDLTPAEGSVAQAIARRIPKDKNSEAIPFRTIYAEAIGVKSKDTIQRALERLEALGVISISPTVKGSRKSRVITWALTCPGECQKDHSKGNKKLSKTVLERQLAELPERASEITTRPTHQDTTRPTHQDALRSIKKEREGLLSFIKEELDSMDSLSESHSTLKAALDDPEDRAAINQRAELLAVNAHSDVREYLKSITRKSPHKLLPKPEPTASTPANSEAHLDREIREILARERAEKARGGN